MRSVGGPGGRGPAGARRSPVRLRHPASPGRRRAPPASGRGRRDRAGAHEQGDQDQERQPDRDRDEPLRDRPEPRRSARRRASGAVAQPADVGDDASASSSSSNANARHRARADDRRLGDRRSGPPAPRPTATKPPPIAFPAPVALWHAAQFAWNSSQPRWRSPAAGDLRDRRALARATRRTRPAPGSPPRRRRGGWRIGLLVRRRERHPARAQVEVGRGRPDARRATARRGRPAPAGPWHAGAVRREQARGPPRRPAVSVAGQPVAATPARASGAAGLSAHAPTTPAATAARASRPPSAPERGAAARPAGHAAAYRGAA